MITTVYTCFPKRDYLSLSRIYLQSSHSLLVPGYIFVPLPHPIPPYSHNTLLPRIGDLENSASDDCTSQILSSHFYPLSIPLSLILNISAVSPNKCGYGLYTLYLLLPPLLYTHLNVSIFRLFLFAASHRLSYAVSSVPKPHDTCTPIPCVINSFSSLSPSAIVRILNHSQSQYTEGDSFCKYYSIAFAIHTRLAGGLALELFCNSILRGNYPFLYLSCLILYQIFLFP